MSKIGCTDGKGALGMHPKRDGNQVYGRPWPVSPSGGDPGQRLEACGRLWIGLVSTGINNAPDCFDPDAATGGGHHHGDGPLAEEVK